MQKNTAKRLEIGFILDGGLDKPDGVQQYVLGLGEWLKSKGHSVSYLVGGTARTDIAGVYPLSRNLKVSFNGNILSMPVRSSKSKIKALLSEKDFDILHVQSPYSPLMAAKAINSAGKKTAVVSTFHIYPLGTLARFGSKLLGLFLYRSTRRIDCSIAVSSAAATIAKEHYRLESKVIPNHINLSMYECKKKPDKLVRIVFLGRLVKRKGVDKLLQAIAKINNDNAKYTIKICGDGPMREELEKFCLANNLTDKVKFTGFVTEKTKIKLLCSSDIAVFPSVGGESFGIVLLEAMAAGCTVLAGNNAGYRSVIGKADGSLIDPNNTDRFADRLKGLIYDQNMRDNLRDQQQEIIKQFDVDVVGKKILAEYYNAKYAKIS